MVNNFNNLTFKGRFIGITAKTNGYLTVNKVIDFEIREDREYEIEFYLIVYYGEETNFNEFEDSLRIIIKNDEQDELIETFKLEKEEIRIWMKKNIRIDRRYFQIKQVKENIE
jgi:hypothetical protein